MRSVNFNSHHRFVVVFSILDEDEMKGMTYIHQNFDIKKQNRSSAFDHASIKSDI